MTEIIAVLTGVFQFWKEVKWFIQLLQKTPQEKHQDLIVKIQKEAEHFEETGRPTWD